jgi:methylated-DNA-[protein]-cysteine S-methyltransferase
MSTTHQDEIWTLDRIGTPIGTMVIVVDAQRDTGWESGRDPRGVLRALDWEDCADRLHRLLRLHYGPGVRLLERRAPAAVRDPLEAYFAGDIAAIDLVRVDTNGTPFQRSVWAALRAIRSGTTVTYAELAARLGRPTAARAVGLANGSNPVGIVVPCHRVIGANAQLTGYAGGIERKRWLLSHEGALPGLAS